MIKSSSVDVETVVYFIHSNAISPDWMQMQLPPGRNMSQCLQAAKEMSLHCMPLSIDAAASAATRGPAAVSPPPPPPHQHHLHHDSILKEARHLARIAPRPYNLDDLPNTAISQPPPPPLPHPPSVPPTRSSTADEEHVKRRRMVDSLPSPG
ncbi:hypothetical protein CP533_3331 [Ophiocordyceps camponoti-saundersi (nom. inval.)]|nr:hypothetical protein CP533_3331 [Ophiocordyceps camponoti-saundersi (nom. inval.)]